MFIKIYPKAGTGVPDLKLKRPIAVIPLVLVTVSVLAQENSEPAAQVEVTGSVLNARRDASASKVIVTRNDLARFGDTNLTDALQRIPGISIDRAPGKESVVRMRGLGAGYTQVLINGGAVPPGFSIDSLSPAQIERIEVLRSATADMSAQGIAGTVNVILTTAGSRRQAELKTGINAFDGVVTPLVTGDYSAGNDTFSYGIAGSATIEHQRWPAVALTETFGRNGQAISAYRTVTAESMRETNLKVTPRASWKMQDRTLTVDAMIQRRTVDYEAPDTRAVSSGASPVFGRDLLTTDEQSTQALSNVQWKSALGETGRMESKLTLTLLDRRADSRFDASDEGGAPLLHRTIASDLRDRSVALRGKVAFAMGAKHALDMGWDGQAVERDENRAQLETSPVGLPLDNLAEDYRATVSRLAVFIQDDWTISSALSGYLGLRYEVLTTKTDGNVLVGVDSRSSVVSPTAQLLWKVPGSESDQVRIALGRTFKAPTARELIPRRWIVNQNSATTPNFQGNPDLLPELAWGLDIGYEKYVGKDAFVGVNAYARRIERVVLSHIYRSGTTWIESPVNNGNAEVAGLELEAKGKLGRLFSNAPDVDLRMGMSRNWSNLDSVPGPGNRLNRQPALTGSFGADWHVGGAPLTVGVNAVFEKGSFVRVMANQSLEKSNLRLLDTYAVWKISKGSSMRFTAANLLADDEALQTHYVDQDIDQWMNLRTTTFRKYKLVYEAKF